MVEITNSDEYIVDAVFRLMSLVCNDHRLLHIATCGEDGCTQARKIMVDRIDDFASPEFKIQLSRCYINDIPSRTLVADIYSQIERLPEVKAAIIDTYASSIGMI